MNRVDFGGTRKRRIKVRSFLLSICKKRHLFPFGADSIGVCGGC